MTDSVYKNGNIYCVEPKGTWAQAVAIKNKKFIAVGSNDEIDSYITPETEVIDLLGKTVIPGLHDMHTHALIGSYELFNTCNLPTAATSTLKDLLEMIEQYLKTNPQAEWITGGAWQAFVQDQLHRKHLDAIEPNRPILLYDFSHHNAWVNSKALEIAAIDANTPNPSGGMILRDENGEPTGILLESATQLVAKHIKFHEKYNHKESAKYIMKSLNQYGITSIKDALADKTVLDTYQILDKEDNLNMRIAAYLPWKTSVLGAEATEAEQLSLIENRKQYQSDLVQTNFVKMFIDGVPVAKTAAFFDNYVGEENNYVDQLLIDPDTLKKDFIYLDKQGISIKIHATGDAAISVVLDAIEASSAKNGSTLRHQIAHTNFVSPKDYKRFKQVNAVAEFSPPLWAPTITHEGNKAVLGEKRADQAYPIKSIIKEGTTSVYGSDYPIIPDPNPWYSMEAMITREDPSREFPGALNKREAITVFDAVEIFTINGAKSMYLEDLTGSIEVGKSADMIILNQNIFEIVASEIHHTEVLVTVFGGKKIYENDEEVMK
ncbi:amidohydrolase [Paraliobacillus zengyii]|uniref:amidohydrolase n=1 Tax=Paraliobacillus zengyii TaxID=2213194 RepID=UPI000DD2D1F3|nr:amidohydrolase [Paraliobacillus zengyii]